MTASTSRSRSRTTALAALALAACAPGAALAKDPPSLQACWRSNDFDGFRAIDDHSFNMRTRDGRYFRVETGRCPNLTMPQSRLVTVVRGSDLICGPVDWDLRVGEGGVGGFAEPCIVQSQRRLTPEEVAAIPPKQKP